MSFEDALRTLGLTREDLPAGLRRAYLKLVRVHSPERDPESFKRIREAYELLQTVGPAVAPAELDRADLLAPPPPAANGEFERIDAELEEEDDPARRIELARSALLLERSERAHSLLINELIVAASLDQLEDAEDVIAAAVREAVGQGFESFRSVLRTACPSALSDAELAEWTSELERGQASDGVALAELRLERNDVDEAARVAVVALEKLPQGSHPLHLLRGDGYIRLALALVQREGLSQARAVIEAYARVRPEQAGDDAVLFEATRELVTLYEQIDPRIAYAIAESLASRSSAEIDSTLLDLQRMAPRRWSEALKVFRRAAPTLASLYVQGQAAPTRWRLDASLVAFGPMLLFLALSMCDRVGAGACRSRHTIDLSCQPGGEAFCGAIEKWNKQRTCTTSVAAWNVVEREFRHVADGRGATEAERDALADVRRRTRELCQKR